MIMKLIKNKSGKNILAHLLKVSALVGVSLLFVACNESASETIAQPSNVDGWSEDGGTETVFSSTSVVNVALYIKGEFVDERDGQVYKTVTVGSKTWMAENLKYESDGSDYPKSTKDGNFYPNYTNYGRFYTWSSAMLSCPNGWHLPSILEWDMLKRFASCGYSLSCFTLNSEGKALKSIIGWNSGNRTDAIGFTALPAGTMGMDGERTLYDGETAYFWTSNETDKTISALSVRLNYSDSSMTIPLNKENRISVRCLQDDEIIVQSSSAVKSSSSIKISSSSITAQSSNSVKSSSSNVVDPSSSSMVNDPTVGTFVDSRDGQTYRTVTIGAQTWMAENLNYNRAHDYCFDMQEKNCVKYGRLYTWSSANLSCPNGWHLPSKVEWEDLCNFVGGKSSAGKELKSTSGCWNNIRGTDAFGFSALPAGRKDDTWGYCNECKGAFFWTSTSISDKCYVAELADLYNDVFFDKFESYFEASVRCIKD